MLTACISNFMATNAAPEPSRSSAASDPDTENRMVLSAGRPVPRKLSEVIEQLITEFHMRPVTLREVIVVLQGRAYTLLMLLLRFHALVILLASLVLLLPLPPGTNFPPALCIVIMAGGLLERDGRFILGGYLALAFNGAFFTLLAVYGRRLVEWAWSLFPA